MDWHYAILCCLFMIWLQTICLYKKFVRSYVCLSKKPADIGVCYQGLFPSPDEMENCSEENLDFLREPEKDFNDLEDQKVKRLDEVDSSGKVSYSPEKSEKKCAVPKEHKESESDFSGSENQKVAWLNDLDSSDEMSNSLEALVEEYEVSRDYILRAKKMGPPVQIKNILLDSIEQEKIPKSFEDRFNASRQKILYRRRRQERSVFNFFSWIFLYWI